MVELTIYGCGICDCYHRWTWHGDCRENKERFFPDEYAERIEVEEWTLDIRSMDDRVAADLRGDN